MVKKVVKRKSDVKSVAEPDVSASPTLTITGEREIASDFATKVYEKFDQMIKSIVLFGSSAKQTATPDSDIDIILGSIQAKIGPMVPLSEIGISSRVPLKSSCNDLSRPGITAFMRSNFTV